MATIRPFKGLRPLPEFAAQVAAKPYDVLSSDEARQEVGDNPLSFLHIGKPEIDLPREVSPRDNRVYQKGREHLEKMVASGVLKLDESPCLYLYAQAMEDHTQCGVVACVSVQEYMNDTIKKHELTHPDKEDDRTRHVKVTNAQTGPILMAYRSQPSIDETVERIRRGKAEYDFIAMDGVRHQLWIIRDQNIVQSLVRQFAAIRHLYIADGHHRSAAAVRVARELAAANPHHTGNEEYNFFLAVLFPHSQLKILDYNRVVKDLNGRSVSAFLDQVKKTFKVESVTVHLRPRKKGQFGMYLGRQWYKLTAREHLLSTSDPIDMLDVSILQRHLLAPILGIDDVRIDERIEFVGGVRGLDELERRVDSGEMAIAFSLYPTSIEELFAIADAGKIMPPKSTWFEPKLRDGLVVHLLS